MQMRSCCCKEIAGIIHEPVTHNHVWYQLFMIQLQPCLYNFQAKISQDTQIGGSVRKDVPQLQLLPGLPMK